MTRTRREPRRRAVCPLLALAGLAAALWTGCQSPAAADGMRFGKWWNYYERALARMEARDYAGAAEDLERCLGRRPGPVRTEVRESWFIRTYGMHRLDNYFPHRELGVCLHLLGRDAEAEPLLDTSLRLLPSDRARHFLGQVRARRLAAQAGAGPALAFTGPDPLFTADPVVPLAVRASGVAGFPPLRIEGEPVPAELSPDGIEGRRRVRLAEGETVVTASVTDDAGRTASARRRVVVDTVAPAAVPLAHRREADGAWTVELRLTDAHGLAFARWDGRDLLPPGPRGAAQAVVAVRTRPGAGGALEVSDRAGNSLSVRVGADLLPRLLTSVGFAPTAAVDGGLAVAAAGGNRALPPALHLEGPEPLATFGETVFVDGEAAAPGGLASVTVNGRELLEPVNRGAPRVRFAALTAVPEGAGVVEITVRDNAGGVTARRVNSLRRAPEFARENLRLAAVLTPLVNGEALRTPLPVTELVEHALVNRAAPETRRFQLLARGADFLRLLAEHRLRLSPLVDERAQLEINGPIPGADLFVSGLVYTNSLGVTVRFHLFNEDRQWLDALDVHLPDGEPEERVRLRLRGLVSRLESRFPIRRGRLENLSLPAGTATARLEEDAPLPALPMLIVRPGADGRLESGVVLLDTAGRDLRWFPAEDPPGRHKPSLSGKIQPEQGKIVARPGDHVISK